MRHSIYGKKLSRDTNQRTALFKSLVQSLILSEKIQITKARADAVKGLVDHLITQAKSPTSRRLVSQFLTDKRVSEKLIKDLLPRLADRTSGYTSIIKLGYRQGDGAKMVQMSLLLGASSKSQESSKAKAVSKEPLVGSLPAGKAGQTEEKKANSSKLKAKSNTKKSTKIKEVKS